MSDKHVSASIADAFDLPSLWRGQRRLLATRRPQVMTVGGLGSGKTAGLWMKNVQLAVANPGRKSWIVGPTLGALEKELWPETLAALATFRERMGFTLERSRRWGTAPMIRWRGGGLQYWMGEHTARSSRSASLSYAIVDELTKLKQGQRTYEEILGRRRGPAGLGQIVIAGNMDCGDTGLLGWWVRQVEAGEPDYDLIVSPTWENQFLDDSYIHAQMKGLSRARVAALICGLLLKPQATMWGAEFDSATHVIDWDPVCDGMRRWSGPRAALPWGVSCDWGARPHLLVLQRMAIGTDWRVYHPSLAPPGAVPGVIVVDEDARDHGGDTRARHEYGKRIAHWEAKFRCRPGFGSADRANPDMCLWLWDQLAPDALRWRAKSRDEQLVHRGLEEVRRALDPIEGPPYLYIARRVVQLATSAERGIYQCMLRYRREMAGGDFTSRPHQDNVYEHGADALRYAMMALFGTRGETFGGLR